MKFATSMQPFYSFFEKKNPPLLRTKINVCYEEKIFENSNVRVAGGGYRYQLEFEY